MSGKVVLLLALVSLFQYTAFAKTSTVACYFTNWTVYRNGLGQFKILNIDTNLCTHIFYAFEGIYPDGTFKIVDEWGDINLNQIQDIMSLKQKKPDLKILVSVGGYGAASANFRDVAASGTARANFITTTLAAIKKYGFDGLDIVWEYPSTPADKENFARLVQEASATFKIHNLLLSAAVAPSGGRVTAGYDIPVLSKNLDIISLMEYDFHGYYDGYTGSNAPLYHSSLDPVESDKDNNVNRSVSLWIALGADPQKLVLGIPFYGKSYRLTHSENHGLGAPVTGAGPMGHYTQQDGVLGYNEICELQAEGGWTIVIEPEEKVPYMYKDNVWISYDNVASINSKVQYAKQKNLQGISVWSLGIDDFHGTCGKANILLNAINDALQS